MKKSVRIVSIIVLLCLLCLTLSGCRALEDARSVHGFWIKEGDRFRLGNSEYIRLPESGALDFLYMEQDSDISDIYVTTEDVPLLLSSFFGVAFTPSSDGKLCVGYEGGYFCRSDYYPALAEQLVKGFEPVGYCCIYTEWDEEQYAYKERAYRLTAEETAAVGAMLEGNRTYLPDMAEANYDYSVGINFCSEDLLLQKFAVELCCSDNRYFLLGDDFDSQWVIDIPLPYVETAQALLEPVIEEYESYEYEEYYDESYDLM